MVVTEIVPRVPLFAVVLAHASPIAARSDKDPISSPAAFRPYLLQAELIQRSRDELFKAESH